MPLLHFSLPSSCSPCQSHGPAAGEGAAALVYLFVFGWLTGLGLAQLYKIIPVPDLARMLWAPFSERSAVPLFRTWSRRTRKYLVFCLLFGGDCGYAFALCRKSGGVRRRQLAQLCATVGLMVELVRARMLSTSQRPSPSAGDAKAASLSPHL